MCNCACKVPYWHGRRYCFVLDRSYSRCGETESAEPRRRLFKLTFIHCFVYGIDPAERQDGGRGPTNSTVSLTRTTQLTVLPRMRDVRPLAQPFPLRLSNMSMTELLAAPPSSDSATRSTPHRSPCHLATLLRRHRTARILRHSGPRLLLNLRQLYSALHVEGLPIANAGRVRSS